MDLKNKCKNFNNSIQIDENNKHECKRVYSQKFKKKYHCKKGISKYLNIIKNVSLIETIPP
jgi:hypothetical protein